MATGARTCGLPQVRTTSSPEAGTSRRPRVPGWHSPGTRLPAPTGERYEGGGATLPGALPAVETATSASRRTRTATTAGHGNGHEPCDRGGHLAYCEPFAAGKPCSQDVPHRSHHGRVTGGSPAGDERVTGEAGLASDDRAAQTADGDRGGGRAAARGSPRPRSSRGTNARAAPLGGLAWTSSTSPSFGTLRNTVDLLPQTADDSRLDGNVGDHPQGDARQTGTRPVGGSPALRPLIRWLRAGGEPARSHRISSSIPACEPGRRRP